MTTLQTLIHKPSKLIQANAPTIHGDGDTAQPLRIERTKVRYPKPLVVVPVLPDGLPDRQHRALGVSLDIAPDGELELYWEDAPELPTTAVVALLQQADGTNRAVGIEVVSVHNLEKGAIKIVGRIGGFAEEILSPEKLMPTFTAETLDFRLGFQEEMLDQWAAIGALEAVFVDKVDVCPKCKSLPTYRLGCPNCGSARLDNDLLIHHFACAHVAKVGDFESAGGLTCPKCRTCHLVVASDFDYVTGPYRCLDCSWSNLEPEDVAHCLNCQYRFPAYQTDTRELRGFRAHRLDLLAVLPAS